MLHQPIFIFGYSYCIYRACKLVLFSFLGVVLDLPEYNCFWFQDGFQCKICFLRSLRIVFNILTAPRILDNFFHYSQYGWGLFWMFLLFPAPAPAGNESLGELLHPNINTSNFFFLSADFFLFNGWIWLFRLALAAFCGLKSAEVVQNQCWPSAKSFINSFDMLQDYWTSSCML